MASKTISQQKVADLSHMMVKHLNDKLEVLRDQVRLKIEESLKSDYSKEVLDFFEKYPKIVNKCQGISIYWNFDGYKDYKFTVYPNLPKYTNEGVDLDKIFIHRDGLRRSVISDLMDEYCQVFKKRDELRNKIKCTLNTLKPILALKANSQKLINF